MNKEDITNFLAACVCDEAKRILRPDVCTPSLLAEVKKRVTQNAGVDAAAGELIGLLEVIMYNVIRDCTRKGANNVR